jgi:hypothetical protein
MDGMGLVLPDEVINKDARRRTIRTHQTAGLVFTTAGDGYQND